MAKQARNELRLPGLPEIHGEKYVSNLLLAKELLMVDEVFVKIRSRPDGLERDESLLPVESTQEDRVRGVPFSQIGHDPDFARQDQPGVFSGQKFVKLRMGPDNTAQILLQQAGPGFNVRKRTIFPAGWQLSQELKFLSGEFRGWKMVDEHDGGTSSNRPDTALKECRGHSGFRVLVEEVRPKPLHCFGSPPMPEGPAADHPCRADRHRRLVFSTTHHVHELAGGCGTPIVRSWWRDGKLLI